MSDAVLLIINGDARFRIHLTALPVSFFQFLLFSLTLRNSLGPIADFGGRFQNSLALLWQTSLRPKGLCLPSQGFRLISRSPFRLVSQLLLYIRLLLRASQRSVVGCTQWSNLDAGMSRRKHERQQ